MGTPPAPIVENYFIEYSEQHALNTAPERPTCWYKWLIRLATWNGRITKVSSAP
jgi:hypothetical protein